MSQLEGATNDRGCLYLIDAGLGLYKIGHVLDPWQGLRDMQVGPAPPASAALT
jgi:hypothetical protein